MSGAPPPNSGLVRLQNGTFASVDHVDRERGYMAVTPLLRARLARLVVPLPPAANDDTK
jgi:hypothetical protein